MIVIINVKSTPQWNSLLKVFDSLPNYKGEKIGLAQALGRTVEPALINQTMALLLRQNISATDKDLMVPIGIIMGIAANPVSRTIATMWMRDHWADLVNAVPGIAGIASTMLADLASSRKEIQEWKEWLEGPDVMPGAEGVEAVLDKALERIGWAERDAGVVRDFLGIH
jgi:hypothetical protein